MSTAELYPELIKAGGLNKALNADFEIINSSLSVMEDEFIDRLPLSYACVQLENKFSQVYLAVDERLYLPDFWKNGVCLAHGSTDNLRLLATALDAWLVTDIEISELAKRFDFVKLEDRALFFEKGEEVRYEWNALLNDTRRSELYCFIRLAIEDEILGRLFPFTSLDRLCFSRCTGYPYTCDLPFVCPVLAKENTFEIRLPDGSLAGIANAVEALQIIKSNLPKDIQPATKGTADDLL